jgi:hypothetical protein
MGLLFLIAVAVQYNDPDPLRWMAIYGAATAACALDWRGRLPRWLAPTVGLVALAWTLTLIPKVVGRVELGGLFREVAMASLAIEEAREALGLLIVAGWMLVLVVRSEMGRAAHRAPIGRRPSRGGRHA